MAAKVEIKFCGVSDADIHGGAGGDVARSPGLLFEVGAKQSSVVAFLHNYESDTRLVVGF